ncbi:MAG: hypothetical protein ACRDRV_02760 [Pseudonocardiaceae bacterium]
MSEHTDPAGNRSSRVTVSLGALTGVPAQGAARGPNLTGGRAGRPAPDTSPLRSRPGRYANIAAAQPPIRREIPSDTPAIPVA